MTELHLLTGAGTTAATATADAVVVGVLPARSDEDTEKATPRLAPGAAAVDAAFDGELAALLAVAGATGRADEVVKLPTRARSPRRWWSPSGSARPGTRPVGRAAAPGLGAAARALAGTDRAVTTLSCRHGCPAADAWPPPPRAPCSAPTRSPTTRRPRGRKPVPGSTLRPQTPTHRRRGRAAPGDGRRRGRHHRPRPGQHPAERPAPAAFAARAAARREAAGLEVEVLDEAALAAGGYGGILGVGQGSDAPAAAGAS